MNLTMSFDSMLMIPQCFPLLIILSTFYRRSDLFWKSIPPYTVTNHSQIRIITLILIQQVKWLRLGLPDPPYQIGVHKLFGVSSPFLRENTCSDVLAHCTRLLNPSRPQSSWEDKDSKGTHRTPRRMKS